MKILIGVCGIGKGHCIRQYEICKALINRGHEVRVLTYLEGINFFEKTDIKFYKVFVPLVLYKGDKLDIFNCLRRNFCVFIPGLIKNRKVMRSLFKEGFIPDVCISDYEPIVAKISYKLKKPLLNIDQQSKFIYMDKEIIHGFSCVEEKKRLNLFFPKYNNKYIVSFYNLKNINLPQNVEVLYPIIAEDIRNKQLQIKTKNKIIVYFSKFIDIPIRQTYVEVINIFENINNFEFVIFSTELYGEKMNIGKNIKIYKNEREKFIEELLEAKGVISTAGHTLISESFYLGKPVFVLPLPTFDQHYCAKIILENDLGYAADKITITNLKNFLLKLNLYSYNIAKSTELIEKKDTLNYLIKKIEEFKKE